MSNSLLKIKNLNIMLRSGERSVPLVSDLNFEINKGEIVGIVGESGCGKSMTSSAIMGMLPSESIYVREGSSITFCGTELVNLPEREYRRLRGDRIAMVHQDAMAALNPVLSIRKQMIETLLAHRHVSKAEALSASIDMLRRMGIPAPEIRINDYPHQLSGGMRQRVGIAIALLCEPELIIADEPTTALDVTIQAQILELLKKVRKETGTSVLLITHDMGVIAELADKTIVMYAGRMVERADTRGLFKDPKHPYTRGLLGSIPRLDVAEQKINPIPGTVPAPGEINEGCCFYSRCPYGIDKCERNLPPVVSLPDREICCWMEQRGLE